MKTTERANYGVPQIAQLFPSLKKIKDKSLRERVAAVWNEAITTGAAAKAGPSKNFARSSSPCWPAISR